MRAGLAACAAVMIFLSSCNGASYKRFSADYPGLFDSYVTVTGCAESREEFDARAGLIYEKLLRLHRLCDIYNDYDGINNLKAVNDNAGISPVKVEEDILGLLEFGLEAHKASGGAVNIAMGPVLRVWHDYRAQSERPGGRAELPPYELLLEASVQADISGLIIDRHDGTVFLKEKGMSLDVGAIAKGYAAREAVSLARESGMESALVNMGGNVSAAGPPAVDRDAWIVGLQDPDETSALMDKVRIRRESVVTSGDYQRFYTVDGRAYNHIIDPRTLMPAERWASVTVICGDSAAADMLSTSLFILPKDEGLRLLEKYSAEAIWTRHDGTTQETPGFDQYR